MIFESRFCGFTRLSRDEPSADLGTVTTLLIGHRGPTFSDPATLLIRLRMSVRVQNCFKAWRPSNWRFVRLLVFDFDSSAVTADTGAKVESENGFKCLERAGCSDRHLRLSNPFGISRQWT